LKYLLFILVFFLTACVSGEKIIRDHVEIEVYTYEKEGSVYASAMPALRTQSELQEYARRFEYILINVSEIHLPAKADTRNAIWSLYPDTIKLKKLYLQEFAKDKRLADYMKASYVAINRKKLRGKALFSEDELMEVASKFFYCDAVFPDTTIQTHICIGLNGVSEASWDKDFLLLEAFCYEVIFDDLLSDNSLIDRSYSVAKQNSVDQLKPSIVSLDLFLNDVRLALFEKMKNDEILKEVLLKYYSSNKRNLAFRIK
jgi:hypothetical protein